MQSWQEMPSGKEKYHRYLASPEWGRLRAQVHARANGVCEKCKRAAIDAVHHLTYVRIYQERLEDLLAVCDACHKGEHGVENSNTEKADVGSEMLSLWASLNVFRDALVHYSLEANLEGKSTLSLKMCDSIRKVVTIVAEADIRGDQDCRNLLASEAVRMLTILAKEGDQSLGYVIAYLLYAGVSHFHFATDDES